MIDEALPASEFHRYMAEIFAQLGNDFAALGNQLDRLENDVARIAARVAKLEDTAVRLVVDADRQRIRNEAHINRCAASAGNEVQP